MSDCSHGVLTEPVRGTDSALKNSEESVDDPVLLTHSVSLESAIRITCKAVGAASAVTEIEGNHENIQSTTVSQDKLACQPFNKLDEFANYSPECHQLFPLRREH